MQIQCHNHAMQARYACGCGHTSSSRVGGSVIRGYVFILPCSPLPHEDCLWGSDAE